MEHRSGTAQWRQASQRLAARMAGRRDGRILLHLGALALDGQVRWHLRGVARELAPDFNPLRATDS
jgi:hypothetical protein